MTASAPAAAPVLIAGGGIGGLALALALAQRRIVSVVLEARPQFVTAGAGIQLGPNGVAALRRLGVADAVAPFAGVPESLKIRSGASGLGRAGDVLATLPLGVWIETRYGAPYWTVHRADLHGALLAACSGTPLITLRTAFEVASFTATAGGVDVRSTMGETAEGVALIGADGLWSRVRALLAPDAALAFSGASATRAVLPVAQAGGLGGRSIGLWLGPGINVAHYPVRRGAELAVVIIAADDWRETGWDRAVDRALVLPRVQRLDGRLADALGVVTDWRRWSLYRLPPLAAWSRGRVGLVGDAAHPMLPHLAQGGVLALEDALVLADCLAGALTQAHGDIPAALQAFEARRRRRATRVQAVSRRNGRIYHMAAPLSWARDSALRILPPERLMAGFDWLYGWSPNGERKS